MIREPDPTLQAASTPRKLQSDPVSGRLCLVVIGEGLDATYPLPSQGRVAIGRAPDSDIRIDHPSVSRNHALLVIGDTLVLEDLGSVNGVRVGDRWLHRQEKAEVGLGEPFDVGTVMVVVQQRSMPVSKRHIWAHGYFEARVDEECARSQRSGASFAVVRVHCASAEQGRVVEESLCRVLRAMDVIGYYGPSEHEVLVVDTTAADLGIVTTKISNALLAEGVKANIGVAIYPSDARNPYELMERASAAALGRAVRVPADSPLVIANAMIQNLDRIVHRIAAGTISVMITGETGVGKEVLAERIHKLSRRADKPILRLNCAALSETLLESELFGHEKGSFTGATQAKAGLLETADGGTVFLDELGELPMSMQVKLLRVIEERQVMRVGALKSRFIDVRFLSATNRDLEVEIGRQAFRQDLYFRLNGITLVIPPLRERVSEIPGLAEAFLRQAAERNGLEGCDGISSEALSVLAEYNWPGNIRELRNVMERAVLLSNGAVIGLEHLPMEKMRTSTPRSAVGVPLPPGEDRPLELDRRRAPESAVASPARTSVTPRVTGSLASAVTAPVRESVTPPVGLPVVTTPAAQGAWPELEAPLETITDERTRVIEALARAGGNQTVAAGLLGVSRRTLINRVEQFGIPRPRKK